MAMVGLAVVCPKGTIDLDTCDDPLVAERQRREYESLFASNVVLSRRPDGSQPDAGQRTASSSTDPRLASGEPSIDEIADAVVRATSRTTGALTPPPGVAQVAPTTPVATTDASRSERPNQQPTPRISALGPLHRVLEGTIIDAVLTNRLDGAAAAPVNCLVTNPLYSHSGQQVLIPAGARVLGETRPVQALGQTRLAVAFHRLLMPDGSTVPLDQFKGLNQIGESGLRDRVNHHFLSTFGAAGAIGLVSGLSQLLGNAAFGIGDGNRTVVIAGSAADATAQASAQVMSRFLNRLPTISLITAPARPSPWRFTWSCTSSVSAGTAGSRTWLASPATTWPPTGSERSRSWSQR